MSPSVICYYKNTVPPSPRTFDRIGSHRVATRFGWGEVTTKNFKTIHQSSYMFSKQMNSFGKNHPRHFWRIWKLSVVRCPYWPLNTGQNLQYLRPMISGTLVLNYTGLTACSSRIHPYLSVRSKHVFYGLSVTVSVSYYKRESGFSDARNFEAFWTELTCNKLRAVSFSFSSDLVRGVHASARNEKRGRQYEKKKERLVR